MSRFGSSVLTPVEPELGLLQLSEGGSLWWAFSSRCEVSEVLSSPFMSVEENILFCSPEVSFVGGVGPGGLSSTQPKWSRLVRVLMWGGGVGGS